MTLNRESKAAGGTSRSPFFEAPFKRIVRAFFGLVKRTLHETERENTALRTRIGKQTTTTTTFHFENYHLPVHTKLKHHPQLRQTEIHLLLNELQGDIA